MISAILLAAGESRRMGDFKQLLRLGHQTFVEHCVDNLLASRVDEVIVVTGHRELEIRSALGNRPVRFAHNSDYLSGMSTSIKRGVQEVSYASRACVLALVDQPQIGAQVMNRIIETYETGQARIVVPTCEGRNGHPIVIDLSLKEEILGMDDEQGLRQVVRADPTRVAYVEIASNVVLEDCDLPEDYERLLKQ